MASSKSLRHTSQSAAQVGSGTPSLVWKGWTKITQAFAFRSKERRRPTHCPFCKTGQLQAARVSVTTRWGNLACEVRGVPADICVDCGQYKLAPPIVLRVQDLLVEDTRSAPTRGMIRLAYRRRRVRVNLPGSLQGPGGSRSDVRVVNLSPDGALIEHAVLLSPSESCFLSIRLPGADVCLRARVIWSRVQGSGKGPGESDVGVLPFRSGLQFPDLPEEEKEQMAHYLATLSTPNSDAGNGGK